MKQFLLSLMLVMPLYIDAKGAMLDAYTSSDIISFSDNNTKAICVANWDTNGDGELSMEEASAVTTIGTVFQGNSTIDDFREFRYFTNVTSIGEYELAGCTNLSKIEFPSSLKTLDRYALYNSGFESIELPNGVTSIGNSAIRGCTKLTSVKFGNGTVAFGKNVFRGCTQLSTISFDGTECHFNAEDSFRDCSALTSVVITDLSAWCRSTFIYASTNPLSFSHSLSLNVSGNISEITNLVIPSDITAINTYAFYGCDNIESVTIGNDVSSIGNYAFACSNLTSVTVFNKTPVEVGSYTFSNLANATLYVHGGCKAAYETAAIWKLFSNIVELKNGDVFRIYDSNQRFHYKIVSEEDGTCSLGAGFFCKEHVVLPAVVNGYVVIGIEKGAFEDEDEMVSISLPSTLQYIKTEAFYHCTVQDVYITSLEAWNNITMYKSLSNPLKRDLYLNDEKVTNLVLPNTITSVSANFSCGHFLSVTIPKTVTSIASGAFSSNTLLDVYVKNSSPLEISATTFYNMKNITLHVPFGTKELYSNADIWKSFKEIVEKGFNGDVFTEKTIEGVDVTYEVVNENLSTCKVGYTYDSKQGIRYAIDQATSGTVTIPQVVKGMTVSQISSNAFEHCSNITNVVLPNTIKSVGSNSFSGCSKLETINIPNALRYFGTSSFSSCSSLKTINIPQGVTNIPRMAFEDCSSLDSVAIPEGVTAIGIRAFSGCSSLTEITIPGTVSNMETWDNCWAFASCSSLKCITINEGVSVLGCNTFDSCNNVEKVIVWNKTPIVVYSSFDSFANRATLYVPKGCIEAYQNAYGWNYFKEILEIPMLGDVNNDGEVDAQDASLVLQYVAKKIDSIEIENADVNNDGNVDAQDASLILQYVAKKISW